ncbi:MAG: hypothetical protein HQ580_19035, partial [Planctomycetes bacterium]|nr:hypothetical protein [Planctomycetota bacterium]
MSSKKTLFANLDCIAERLQMRSSFSQVWKKMKWMSSKDKDKLLKWWYWIFLDVKGAFDLLDLDGPGLE